LLSIQSDYSLPAHLQGKELRKALEQALVAMITRRWTPKIGQWYKL
jgi:hypothetical protein